MGWLQYSCMLGLSSDYPYILYIKAIKAQRLDIETSFPHSRSKIIFHLRKALRLGQPLSGAGARRAGDVWRELLRRARALQAGWPRLIGWPHGHVNVFENFAALDAAAAVGGFNQIIARLPTLFPPEYIDEHQRLGELLGLDQEACAIDVPCASRIHVVHPLGEGEPLVVVRLMSHPTFREGWRPVCRLEFLLKVTRIYSGGRSGSIPNFWCNEEK